MNKSTWTKASNIDRNAEHASMLVHAFIDTKHSHKIHSLKRTLTHQHRHTITNSDTETEELLNTHTNRWTHTLSDFFIYYCEDLNECHVKRLLGQYDGVRILF